MGFIFRNMFCDSHTHIEFPEFDADRDQVIERMHASGVQYIMAIGSGSGPSRLTAGIEVAEGRDWVFPTVGVHPHDAAKITAQHLIDLRALSKNPKVVAMGELGLDYHYADPPRDVQKTVLHQQIELAAESKLPLIIHCRDAWSDCLDILESEWKNTGLGGIFHCFSGSIDDARRGMEMGFLISFAGNVTFPKAIDLREVAALIPVEKLLIETDCPFLAPVPRRGKRNEPSFVPFVASQLGELHGLSGEDMGNMTSKTFLKFIGDVKARRGLSEPIS
jgi:TatD DNase family protein